MVTRSMLRTRTVIVSVVLSAVVAACGPNADDKDSQQGGTTTLPPVSTTVASQPGAAEAAWATFITSYEVIDSSAVSNGPCGPRAVLITEGSTTTYWWDGVRWNDDTSMLDGSKGNKPSRVYTHDFTNDGVDDFVVVFDDNVRRTGNRYVSILAYPWVETEQCKWRWMDIDNGLDTNKRFDITGIDTRTWTIRGIGYSHRRLTRGRIEFLPASSSFVFQPTLRK